MFVTQKMILLDVLVLQKDADAVSQLIVQMGTFEPSYLSSTSVAGDKRWIQPQAKNKIKNMTDLQKTAMEISSFYKPYLEIGNTHTVVEHEKEWVFPIMNEKINQYKTQIDKNKEWALSLHHRREEIAVKMAGLRMYQQATQSAQENLKHPEKLFSTLGVVNDAILPLLQKEFEKFEGVIELEGHIDNSTIIFIAVSNEQVSKLKEMLDQFYVMSYGLPAEFFGKGSANMMKLALELVNLDDEEIRMEKERIKAAPQVIYDINKCLDLLDFNSQVSEVQSSMKQAGHFILLSGWIVAKEFRRFKEKLEKICEKRYELTVKDSDTFALETEIPTELSNPKILAPFQSLVTTFGIPNYREIDPTMIFSFLYIIMYGAMFGDVGQGAVLFFLGALGLLLTKSKNNAAQKLIFSLMTWVGTSAVVFGLLYGSYFGYESATHTGIPDPLWLSPMHNTILLLTYSVLFGVLVIFTSYILGIINAIRMKDLSALLFSHKGLVALIVYSIVLIMAYMAFKGMVIPVFMWIVFGLLSLFLGMERIWEALFYGHGQLSDWWMGIFDMFEFYLSMLTNTLSFVRIGAFALTHSALMTAVFTLSNLSPNPIIANITLLIGNIFVIVVEGFIVGIQTLRLEYYEFFIRFFRGSGRFFKPVKTSSRRNVG